MPDLGRYAAEVLSAYGGSILALAMLVGLSARRFWRVRDEERRAERGQGG